MLTPPAGRQAGHEQPPEHFREPSQSYYNFCVLSNNPRYVLPSIQELASEVVCRVREASAKQRCIEVCIILSYISSRTEFYF